MAQNKKTNPVATPREERRSDFLMKKNRRRTFAARGVGLLLLLVLAIPVTLTAVGQPAPVTPVASESPAPTETEPAQELTPTEEAAQGVATSTLNVVAEQIVEKYGEEIAEQVQFVTDMSYNDDEGNPAVVAIATLHGVPADFDRAGSVEAFKGDLSSIGESWQFEENTTPPAEDIEFINDLFMFATEEAEATPAAAIRVTYLKEKAQETMSVTVTVTSYDENVPASEAPTESAPAEGTDAPTVGPSAPVEDQG